jgi:iron-sulfur cluster assembly protein
MDMSTQSESTAKTDGKVESKPEIDVTPLAIAQIKKAAAARDKKPTGLRVGIRGGGCTGFTYMFEWSDKEPRPEDLVLTYEDGAVRVFIDPKSRVFLRGSTLDYARTLMQRGFKWINPNAKGSCGCGESVQF